jgi:6-pyruvoyltetrahydropterin/6-carboxytetrahydropterin synthase
MPDFMELERTYTLEAAHRLPNVPDGHKCKRLHGHSYTITITVYGPVGLDGMVMDFAAIDDAVKPIIEHRLDHQCLNDVIDNPTSENLARWLYHRIITDLSCLSAVSVSETGRSKCTYRPQVTPQ